MKKHWATAALAVVLLGGVGVAVAQGGDAAAAAPGGAANEVSGQQDVSLPPKEMLTRAQGYIPVMEKSRETVAEQLAEAKKRKDVVKSLCLDDKVKQMNLAIDTARDRVLDLNAAVTQNDLDRSRHEFTVIQVLRDRVQTLITEAQQCIGEETGFVGDSNIVVDVDPAIPDTDASDFPEDTLVSEPPVLSSPTL